MSSRKPKLIPIPSVELRLTGSDGVDRRYSFVFYQAIWTGGEGYARYICYSPTVGCEEVYGEGLGWHRAMTDCLNKLVAQGRIKQ